VRATQDNLAIQPLRRADRALLTAPQLTGAGAQRRGARPRGALRARPDLHLALFRGASNQSRIYSVMALSNQSGQLSERYGYTPYGKRRVVSPGGVTLAASAVGNQVGFTGRYHDGETGQTYFRARYLDTELGRFVGRDPLRYVDGQSLYRAYLVPYRLDPSGRATASSCDYEVSETEVTTTDGEQDVGSRTYFRDCRTTLEKSLYFELSLGPLKLKIGTSKAEAAVERTKPVTSPPAPVKYVETDIKVYRTKYTCGCECQTGRPVGCVAGNRELVSRDRQRVHDPEMLAAAGRSNREAEFEANTQPCSSPVF